MDVKWIVNDPQDTELVQDFALELHVPEIIARLLVNRGITTTNEAIQFFKPNFTWLHDPFLMIDMDRAVERLSAAIQKKEKMTILFTSHNMTEVSQICERVIFLDKGKIIAEDTPLGLSKRIKSCRVRLLFSVSKGKVRTLLENYQYKFWEEKREFIIEIKEEKVGQPLGRLSLAHLKYLEIAIEKPTLEDFFLSVARRKND